MAKQSGFMKALQLERDRRDAEVRHHARVFMLDMVTLALGRMGWRESKFVEFDKVLSQVEVEYSKDILNVGKQFVPYDERYK